MSHSEAGSETDPTPSDLESFGYQSSHGPSPALSLASLTGGNLYSSTLLSPQPLRAYPGGSAHLQRLSSPRPLSTPSNTSPRLGISTGKRVQAPRPVSLPSFPLQIPSGGSSPLPSLYGKDQVTRSVHCIVIYYGVFTCQITQATEVPACLFKGSLNRSPGMFV